MKRYVKIIKVVALVLMLLGVGAFVGYTLFAQQTSEPIKEAITPLEIIETFEISALNYRYRNLFMEENIEERKFAFIELSPAVKRYAVQYDGEIKMGVNGDDVKLEIQQDNVGNVLKITIPKAEILSHEAPLNDTFQVVFDEAEHSEKYTIGEYANTLNDKKKETELEVEQSGLLKQAQESAEKQISALLRSIPDIRDNYILVFDLE